VLRDLGLPRDEFLTALLTFNLGVEGGQLTIIAAASLATIWFVRRPRYRERVVVPASLAIAAVGTYWTVARLISSQ
jgi:multisubunit Na+/H+ antiporter MnhF subunit